MEKNENRLILLFSLVLVIVPMVIFPSRLGLPLVNASILYMFLEMLYYGVVLFAFRRQIALTTLVTGIALTLVYRMALGAVFGLIVTIMYDFDASVAVTLGLARYLPAVLLHVIVAPFILRTFYLNLADNMSSPQAEPIIRFEIPDQAKIDRPADSPVKGLPESAPPAISRHEPHHASVAAGTRHDPGNQFDQAVQYLGESAAVRMALLVDDEGLTLARFIRGGEDYECWAPLALILENENRQVLNRYVKLGHPTRLDIMARNTRIVLRRIDRVVLMVVTDDTIDETIHIRLAQASDMIRKYMSERYSPQLFARAEERYVSNS